MVFKKMKKKRNHDNLKQWQSQKKEEPAIDAGNSNIEPRKTRLQMKLINPVADSLQPQTKATNMPKKKRHLPQRKNSGADKPIIIDDDQASASVSSSKTKYKLSGELVETLQMQCWSEELSATQLEVVQKREQEYNELITRLEALCKQNGGDVVYKGDSCTAYQFNTNPPSLSSFPQTNGVSGQTTTTATTTTPTTTTTEVTKAVSSKPTSAVAVPTSNTYKLVMDPRLGLIVGTMTPTPSGSAVTNVPTWRPRRGRPSSAASLTALQQQFGPATSTTPVAQSVRPAESTAVGGLAAGTAAAAATAAKPSPSAIVDLTSDDGRPPPDSREVAFNKVQGKTFPSLVVVARPHLHAKEASNANDRSMLDTKVKSVLVHTPTKFTEWLIQQGLVRSEQHCAVHPNVRLNLGMYSDVTKFPYSGGYVWISDCCTHRFVSVFSGSLFEGATHSPTVLLKLLYHWACQTNIQNVVQWVKVDNLYVKGLFTWLRAVCTFSLQQHLKPMGGLGKKIEVGVISLGTTSQDGSQRQVKVEVLGILDPDLRVIRLRAVEPLADGERNYKRRFSKILEPLRSWVHPDSTIATDLTVDKGTLHFMGFSNIIQSTQTGMAGNQGVMEYLRKIVPRMFQNTLSLLSRQIIQQFLDELVWREWYGQTASQAFNNIVLHLAEQTRMNVGESLIQRLNKVAANPFKNHHAFLYQSTHKIDPPPGIKRYGRKRAAATVAPSAIIDLEKPKRPHLESTPDALLSEAMVPLESYYYGLLEGETNAPLAQRVTLNVRCCVCKVPYTNNVALLDHLLAHAHNIGPKAANTQCRYCLAALPNVEELNAHIGELHPADTRYGTTYHCLLCELRYSSVHALGKHLSREHVPQELPYQCGTCGFRCSSHRHAIDHFYNKHDGATTLQCPFCLKSTAVWSSGRIMSTNVTFFLAHLQKHQKKTMAKKCNLCSLWFIQKDTLKEHQQKAHASLAGKKGIKPWALPNNYSLVPKSRIYQQNVVGNGSINLNINVVQPEVEAYNQLTLLIPPDLTCVECGNAADSPNHFPRRISCDSCRYVTNCSAALTAHRAHCRSKSTVVTRSKLAAELHCCCGYASDCGNGIAKHLALCERKTAYPTAEDARLATDHHSHSMLDVLGLVRRHDEPMEIDGDGDGDGDADADADGDGENDVEEKSDAGVVKEEDATPAKEELMETEAEQNSVPDAVETVTDIDKSENSVNPNPESKIEQNETEVSKID